MDIEQAKFLLASYRPDGADADESAFAEALALAAKDRDLGRWLAAERAHDAAFAAALAGVEIPDDLRERILSSLEEANAELTADSTDGSFIGALAQISPPEGLRDEIIAAMEAQVASSDKVIEMPQRTHSEILRWSAGLAVAAALAIAAFLSVNSGIFGSGELTVADASMQGRSFIATTYSKASLDLMAEDTAQLYSHLESNGAATPNAIPEALAMAKGVGCKLIEIEGKQASLICYELASGAIVHVITFDRSSVQGDLPEMSAASFQCMLCPKYDMSYTQWEDGDKAHFAFTGDLEPKQLSKLF